MSASEDTPSSRRAAAMRGPTPGSSVTGRERRSGGVVRWGGGWAAPAQEVGHAISSRADVRADDPAYLGNQLLFNPQALCELGDELGGRDVTEVERPAGPRRGPGLLD